MLHTSSVTTKGLLLFSLLTCRAPTALADPWTQVGSPSRPAWVQGGAERRLRLLAALPAIHEAMHTEFKGYVGNAGPGMAVGLVLDTGLYYAEGFGYADGEKSCKPDDRTTFRAGSLSKVITATTLLTFVDDAHFNMTLDDQADANRFLPELKSVCPDWNDACARGDQHLGITLRHLVSHTAGLANVLDVAGNKIPEWLESLEKSWTLFPPGKYVAYAGVGMEGVGLIEKRLGNKPFEDVVENRLFGPLGMVGSTMNPLQKPGKHRAQVWALTIAHGSWSFERNGPILLDDPEVMLWPAGGLATSVHDMGRFIKMWITGEAPERNGHPIIKAATLQAASQPQFTTVAPHIPDRCDGAPLDAAGNPTYPKDNHGNWYSLCGAASAFGVGWGAFPPYIGHDGALPSYSGSSTIINLTAKIGVTALIATEAFPKANPQPAGLDPGFIDTVSWGALQALQNADAATTTWDGQALAVGVARVLYLSGKSPAASDLANFTPAFATANQLTSASVLPWLTAWQLKWGRCSSFGIHHVANATDVTVRFHCDKGDLDLAVHVDGAAPYQISWSEPPPNVCKEWQPPPPPPSPCAGKTAPHDFPCRCPSGPVFCTTATLCHHACGGNLPRMPPPLVRN